MRKVVLFSVLFLVLGAIFVSWNAIDTEEKIEKKVGRFGPYVQKGEGKDAKRSSIPKDIPAEERNEMISEILAGLNDIYKNLDVNFVIALNESLRSFAHQIAEASGGILGFSKTFFFGFFIGLIGTYKGYTTKRGTESVGLAANSAVVTASLVIFIIDLLAVQVSELFFGI